MNDFVIQCVAELLKMDLVMLLLLGMAVLLVSWLVRFIIQLIQDKYDE